MIKAQNLKKKKNCNKFLIFLKSSKLQCFWWKISWHHRNHARSSLRQVKYIKSLVERTCSRPMPIIDNHWSVPITCVISWCRDVVVKPSESRSNSAWRHREYSTMSGVSDFGPINGLVGRLRMSNKSVSRGLRRRESGERVGRMKRRGCDRRIINTHSLS